MCRRGVPQEACKEHISLRVLELGAYTSQFAALTMCSIVSASIAACSQDETEALAQRTSRSWNWRPRDAMAASVRQMTIKPEVPASIAWRLWRPLGMQSSSEVLAGGT